jgi:hypothetical protein
MAARTVKQQFENIGTIESAARFLNVPSHKIKRKHNAKANARASC